METILIAEYSEFIESMSKYTNIFGYYIAFIAKTNK